MNDLKAQIEKFYNNIDRKTVQDGDPYHQGLCDAYETVLELIAKSSPPVSPTPPDKQGTTEGEWVFKARRNPIGETGDYYEDSIWLEDKDGRMLILSGDMDEDDATEILEKLNVKSQPSTVAPEAIDPVNIIVHDPVADTFHKNGKLMSDDEINNERF